jgi:putative colanic acid biosynthesis acetyltransferase WcaF
MNVQLDIRTNRCSRKWTRRELAGRVLWELLGSRAFAWSPRPAWGWRRMILRLFGARIGRDVHLYPSLRIAVPWNLAIGDEAAVGDGAILYSLGLITIGPRATVSQYAHLCAGSHDHTRPTFDLLKPEVTIGAEAWVCADAFVGPGVEIGARTIVAARAVANRSLPAGVIAAGNPARIVKQRPPLDPERT